MFSFYTPLACFVSIGGRALGGSLIELLVRVSIVLGLGYCLLLDCDLVLLPSSTEVTSLGNATSARNQPVQP